MPSYNRTTGVKPAPHLELCHHCHLGLGDSRQRFLCDSCATDGLIRSQYTTNGQRIETPPLVPPHDDDDRPAAAAPRKRELDAEELTSLHVGVTRESRQRFDDDLLLDAARQISASGRYVEESTGAPAAGLLAAGRLAGLAQHRSEAAAERLVQAGRLRHVEVRYLHPGDGAPRGRRAAGVRLVTGAAAPGPAR
jgi:hypothetical protein